MVQAKSVVLVHGAFADGSSMEPRHPLLKAQGLAVIAVQNPLTSLAEDVSHTQRAIARLEGPIMLVGHSWGRLVSPEPNDDKVSALCLCRSHVAWQRRKRHGRFEGLSANAGSLRAARSMHKASRSCRPKALRRTSRRICLLLKPRSWLPRRDLFRRRIRTEGSARQLGGRNPPGPLRDNEGSHAPARVCAPARPASWRKRPSWRAATYPVIDARRCGQGHPRSRRRSLSRAFQLTIEPKRTS